MEIPVSILLRKISFWLTQGLIRERPQDVYVFLLFFVKIDLEKFRC